MDVLTYGDRVQVVINSHEFTDRLTSPRELPPPARPERPRITVRGLLIIAFILLLAFWLGWGEDDGHGNTDRHNRAAASAGQD